MEDLPRASAEGQHARQQLVENDAEAVDVAAAVDLVGLAPGLLGTHVGRRPQKLAVHRQGALAGIPGGQAEVGDAGLALRVDQEIGWFQVAVDHPALVREVERLGHAGDQLGGLAERRARLRPGDPPGSIR